MSEAQWYVVHTYSGYENKVMTNLLKTVENNGLQDSIIDVKVPMEETIEVKNGKKKHVQRKLFPGYVMVKMFLISLKQLLMKLVINIYLILKKALNFLKKEELL